MKGVFHSANSRPQRKQSFNPHPLIPRTTGTDFKRWWCSSIQLLFPVTLVCQVNLLLFLCKGLIKCIITDISCVFLIVNNLQLPIHGYVGLPANNPAAI